MISSKQEQLIQKLLLKGQTEADIIDYLKKRKLLDLKRIRQVQRKIYELKTAQAHVPPKPGFIRRLVYLFCGIVLLILGAGVGFLCWSQADVYRLSVVFKAALFSVFLIVIGLLCLRKSFTGEIDYDSDLYF